MTSHRFQYLRAPLYLIFSISILVLLSPLSRQAAYGDVSSIIINKYAVLEADAKRGDSSILIHQTRDPNVPSITSLSPGDLLLIIQMQGATIKVPTNPNDSSYGERINLNGAGFYELVKVASYSVDDRGIGTVTFSDSCNGLKHDYSQAGHTQIVLLPQSVSYTVDATHILTAPSWNGDAGGVLGLSTGSLVLNNDIDVTGTGFRGGAVETGNVGHATNVATTTYYSNSSADGGAKGESIGGYTNECVVRQDCYGRGAVANGGGGGDNHGAAGGGGANADNGRAWTGQGVMDAAYQAAWMLEPSYHGSLSNSSGGGRGGYSSSDNDLISPLVVGPDDSHWFGNLRREVGGLGGRTLPYQGKIDRIFFGGGGGAGHATSNAGSSGGNGGGIVFIIANQISGTGAIRTNGSSGGIASGLTAWLDAPGGGGGGGTVLIYSDNITGVQLEAKGGIGGNQYLQNTGAHQEQANGGGGGGGGGKIAISNNTSVFTNVNGGTAGTTNTNAMTLFPVNGGTNGGNGSVDSRVGLEASSLAICQAADLAINLIPSNPRASRDQSFTYQIVVTNQGPSRAAHAPVMATLSSPGLSTLSWTCSPASSCGQTVGTGDVNTTVSLDSHETATFLVTIPAPFDPGTASELVYIATVNPPFGMSDPDLSNNNAVAKTPLGSDNGSTSVGSSPGNNQPFVGELSGGGLGGCNLIGAGSAGAGSFLEVFVLATMVIISRMAEQVRRRKTTAK